MSAPSEKDEKDTRALDTTAHASDASSVEDIKEPQEEPTSHGGDTALVNAPWQYKVIALVTALMLPVGSHFSAAAISAMKTTVKKNLNIDNTRYGVLSSAVSIINTIFPIVGGMAIDLFGSIWGTLAVNVMIILGSLLTALAAQYESFPLMVVGRVVFGVGSGLIVTMQESLLSKWFRTQHLSIAIGLQLSISRLSSFIGNMVANPIALAKGWVWPMWVSLILCVFSIVMNLAYALTVKKLRGEATIMNKTELQAMKQKKTFHWHSIFKFPHVFWLILTIEFIYAAVWSSFQTIATELITIHFGESDTRLAGYKASVAHAVPIVATPVLGFVMDYFGKRVVILWLSAVFLILSSGLLGWSYVDPVVGMVFYSISLAFGPISMITAIGMILPSDYIGTGLGLYKAMNNIGTSILDIVVGVIQDKTSGQGYTGVMLLFIILAAIGFFLILGLWAVQYYKLDNLLEARRSVRVERMREIHEKELALTKKGLDAYTDTPVNKFNYLYVGIIAAALVSAWVLFGVFAASGHIAI
ncbi:major facilitator superfamily domain-containing protein [Gongronella butleri]|nr:major facilitator superfamily domain-containing protein [Gongronella butleri]